MFSLPNKIRFILAFVFFIFTIQSSTSSPQYPPQYFFTAPTISQHHPTSNPCENNKQAQMVEPLDGNLNLMGDTHTKPFGCFLVAENIVLYSKLYELRKKINDINAQTTAMFHTLQNKMDAENAQLTERLNALQAKTDAENVILTGKHDNLETEIAKLKNRKKVHFYVQRTSNFGTTGSVIPFEVARLNEGDAFDLPTGIFKAPVPGIYHFDFSALKEYTVPVDPDQETLTIRLQVNGSTVGSAHNDEKQTVHSVVALNASLRLKAGDTVNLYLSEGEINDVTSRRTHFSGWLVDEDLM